MLGTLVESRLHPALDRALALAEALGSGGSVGSGAGAVRASLERILQGLTDSPAGAAAWSGSALARTGFPVEIAFVAGDPSLRYTAEVAGTEVARGDRLLIALALASDLSGFRPGICLNPEIVDLLRSLQSAGTLKYGAWLGGRHRAEGVESASYKIYAEVPPETCHLADAWERRQVGAPPILPHRRVQLSMLGLQPGRTELYYSSQGLRPGEVATALSRIGLERRAPEVLDLLAEAYGRSVGRVGRELPCSDFGWSYALGPLGQPEAFTFYTFANSLLGGDGRIRAALLRLAANHSQEGWNLSFYEALSRPLAERRGPLTHHGMFGIVVPVEGPLTLSFGLVPPDPSETSEMRETFR
jgi:hypothetical protein